MYCIIFWDEYDNLRPLVNQDGTLFITAKVNDADDVATQFEKEHEEYKCRVISTGGVEA